MPVKIKVQSGYLHSSYFKDLYLYLSQNKLPSSKVAIKKVETPAEKYIPLDSLLFKINPEKETAVLVVPETCVDKIINLYHSSLYAGHQGVMKTYLTINDKFFIPNILHYLRLYIKGCHIHQLACNEKLPPRQLQARINPNYVPLSRLSMDLRVMPRSHKGHKYILCIINEVTNYLITVPIFQAGSFNTPNLGNYSPYELTFGRKPKVLINLESNPDIKVSETFKEYYELLNKRIQYLQNILLNFKSKRLAMTNKDRGFFQYKRGDLIYIISPLTNQLHTISCKMAIKYIGPVVIYKIIDPHNYLLMTLDGKILRELF